MQSLKVTTLLSLAVALSTAPSIAQGQIGGLIKKKVGQAVKGGDKTAPKKEETSNGSRLPRPVTASTFAAFQRGIEVERRERRETAKFLATIKTREQYEACQNQIPMSPEGQKIGAMIGTLKENATTEDVQKLSVKVNDEYAKLTLAKCGEDPSKYSGNWRQAQIAKADAAGVKEFSANLGTKPGPALGYDSATDDDDWFYHLLKEWIPPFCLLTTALQEQAAANGIKVPGQGKDMNYVYTSTEASLLIPLCEILMPILRELQ